MEDNTNIIIELPAPLKGEAKKELGDYLKKWKLVHPRFVGQFKININQGGITSVATQVKASRDEIVKVLSVV